MIARWMVVAALAPGLAVRLAVADELRVADVGITLIEAAEVPARVAGVLAQVLVREGQDIDQGAPIAQIDDADVRLQLQRVEVEYENLQQRAESRVTVLLAEETLRLAQLTLRRAERSAEEFARSVPEAELDRLRMEVNRASLEVQKANEEFRTAQLAVRAGKSDVLLHQQAVEQRRVLAPIRGVVVEIRRRLGEWVTPGETVVRLVRTDRVRAEGFLQVDELGEDLAGRPVTLIAKPSGAFGRSDAAALQRSEFPGRITFVSPEVNPVTGQVRFFAEIENAERRLRPGMNAELLVHERDAP
jgi:macrolide-specific efflux system membrane fusion protein